MNRVTRPADGSLKVYHASDLQRILGLGRDTVYRLLRAGTIRSITAGSQYLIPAEALDDFLAGRSNEASNGQS